MSKPRLFTLIFVLLSGLFFCLPQESSAQFVAIARKIKSMNSGGNDVATVILDAGAARVYKAVIDTLSASPKTRITKRDNPKRHVEFTIGSSDVSMQVDSLDKGLCQIMVLGKEDQNSSKNTTNSAVNAILSVSRKAGIKCSVKQD
jgi:hypothetical protein